MKKFSILIIVLLLLLSGCQKKPDLPVEDEKYLSSIDHYVMSYDGKTTGYQEKYEDVYKVFIDAILNHEETFNFIGTDLDRQIVCYCVCCNPYYFLVQSMEWVDADSPIQITYNYDKEEQEKIIDYLDNEILDIINNLITSEDSTIEKILKVYNCTAQRIDYDYDYADLLNSGERNEEINLYQALQTGMGVCHSYVYLMEFLLEQLGIPCFPVEADMPESNSRHVWLCVEVDSQFYHFDPTWDDQMETSLHYFGMTDERCHGRGAGDFENNLFQQGNPIVCDSERFLEWWNADSFQLDDDHQLTMIMEDGQTITIDLQDFN